MNVRGIKGKVRSIESLLEAAKIDIALITETKLPKSENISIKGYRWIAKPRQKSKGGRIGILIKENLARNTVDDSNIEEHEDLESKWIQIECRPKNISIGVVYGPQENEKIEKVRQIYNALDIQIKQKSINNEVILAGDFNAKLQVNYPHAKQDESRNGKILKEIINENSLHPISLDATQGIWTRQNRKKKEEKSIIDYVLVTEQIKKNITEMIVDRTKEIIEQASYNEAIKEIKKILENTVCKRTTRTDKRQKANNPEIKSLRAKRKQAKKEFQEACMNGQEEEKIIKQKTYIEAQKHIREAIEREEAKKIEIRLTKMAEKAKIDPNIMWNARKRAQGSKELEYNTVTEAGEIIMNAEETKSHIAIYFEDLYQAREGKPEFQEWTDEITTTIKTALQKANNKKQGQEPVTIKETKKAIKILKRKKSQGPDDIPDEIFLEANRETTKTLTKMINNVHEEESIPKSWLKGNIIRLYKDKGQKGKCSNERGITLASNVGKVYERVINERVKEVTQITDAQAGGKEGSATTDHLIALKQIIQEIRNEGKTAYVIFLDVQKAYDNAWLDAILYF